MDALEGLLDTAGVARTETAAGSILFADMSFTWIGSLLLLQQKLSGIYYGLRVPGFSSASGDQFCVLIYRVFE